MPLVPVNPASLSPDEQKELAAAEGAQQQPGTPINPLRDLSAQELSELQVKSPDTFDITSEFQKQKDLWSDPALVQKAADAYNLVKQRGFQISDLPGPKKILGTAVDVAKGFGKQAWNYANAAGAAVAGAVYGGKTEDEMLQDAQRRVAENIAGTESSVFGLAQMAKRGVQKFAQEKGILPKPEELTPEERVKDLFAAVGEAETNKEIEKGHGGFLQPVGGEVIKGLEEAGKPVRPEEVQQLAAGDPVSWYLFGKTLQGAASVAPGALPAAREFVGQAIGKAGQAVSLAGKGLEKVGEAAPNLAPTAGALFGATKAGPAGVFPGIAGGRVAGRTVQKTLGGAGEAAGAAGESLQDLGSQIATAKIQGSIPQLVRDVGASVPKVAAEAGKGAALDIGLAAATSETPQETGSVGLGASLGLLHGLGKAGKHVISGQIVAPREFGTSAETPSSGNFPALDAMHQAAMNTVEPGVKLRMNAIRQFVSGAAPGTDVYLAPDVPTLARELEKTGMSPIQAQKFAGNLGFFTAELPDATGTPRKVIIARDPGAVPHESFHAIQDVIGEEGNRQLDDIVKKEYANQWDYEGQRYASRAHVDLSQKTWEEGVLDETGWGLDAAKEKLIQQLGEAKAAEILPQLVADAKARNPNATAQEVWRDVLSPDEAKAEADRYLARELAAENFDAVFKAGLSGKGKLRTFALAAAGILRGLGIEPLETRRTETGKVEPRFRVTEAVRGAAVEPRGPEQAPPGAVPPILPPAPPQKPTITPPTTGASPEAEEARKIAEAAPAISAKGTRSPRELLGTIAEAIANRGGVKINYLSAPDEPAAATTSNRDVRREIIEAYRTMPPESRALWEKTFFPDRILKTKTGYQVQGWAPEVFAANAHKMAFFLSEVDPSLSPFEIDPKTRTFTPDGWKKLYEATQLFVQNQVGGKTGAGKPLVTPEFIRERGYYAPESKGLGVVIPQNQADFINMLFNFKLPETPRMVKGKLPMNIAGQEVSAATEPGRVEIPVRPRGEYTGKEAEIMGIEGRRVMEVNPLRNDIEAAAQKAGKAMPSLIEAVQKLNLENIKEVETTPEQPEFRGNTLTRSAGFQPQQWRVVGTRNGTKDETTVEAETEAEARTKAANSGLRPTKATPVEGYGAVGMFQPKGIFEDEIKRGRPPAHLKNPPLATAMIGTGFETHREMVDYYLSPGAPYHPLFYGTDDIYGPSAKQARDWLRRNADILDSATSKNSTTVSLKEPVSEMQETGIKQLLELKNNIRWDNGYFRDQSLLKRGVESLKDLFLKSYLEKRELQKYEVPEPVLTQKSFEQVDWSEAARRSGAETDHVVADVAEKFMLHPETFFNSLSEKEQAAAKKLISEGRAQLIERGISPVQFQPEGERPNLSEEPDAIKIAAIKLPNGKVYEADNFMYPTHGGALAKAREAGEDVPGALRRGAPGVTEGFVTNAGEFLTRKEAFKRAKEFGQITGEEFMPRPGELESVGFERSAHGQFQPSVESMIAARDRELRRTEERNTLFAEVDREIQDALKKNPAFFEEALTALVNPEDRKNDIGTSSLEVARKVRQAVMDPSNNWDMDVDEYVKNNLPDLHKRINDVNEESPLGGGAQISGAFQPKTPAEVENMTGDEFTEWTKTLPGGFTRAAYDAGLAAREQGPEQVAQLRDAYHRLFGQFREQVKTDVQAAMTTSFKSQYFREAWEAATGLGSGGETLRKLKAGQFQPSESGLYGDTTDEKLKQRARAYLQKSSIYPVEVIAGDDAPKLVRTSIRAAEPHTIYVGENWGQKAGQFQPASAAAELPAEQPEERRAAEVRVLPKFQPEPQAPEKRGPLIPPPPKKRDEELAANFQPKEAEEIRKLAEDYTKSAGINYSPNRKFEPVPEDLARRVADYYEAAKSNPKDEEVQKSYAALAEETVRQFHAIENAGYKIEPFTGKGEPYKSSADMVKDVRENKHLWYLPTAEAGALGKENPMMADSGIEINGEPLPVNDVFRAVHDFFGHAKEGYQFGPRGEFNAWKSHSEMYSPDAQGALAAETLAQNFWVNYGKHLRDTEGKIPAKGEPGYVPAPERPFAEQKNIVIPEDLLKEARGQFQPETAKEEDYVMPKGATAGARFKKAWITPEGSPVQLGGMWHAQWLDQNRDMLEQKYGITGIPKFEGGDTDTARQKALQAGFARLNYDINSGKLTVEARFDDWRKLIEPVRRFAGANIGDIDNMTVHLLDPTVKDVVDSRSKALFNYNTDAEKMANLPLPEPGAAAGAAERGPAEPEKGVLRPDRSYNPSDSYFKGQAQPEEDLFGELARATEKKKSLTNAEVAKMSQKELKNYYPEAIIPRDREEKLWSNITESPLYKKAKTEDKAVAAFADKLVKFAKDNQDDPAFKAGARWYSEFVPKLKSAFGKDARTFAELLAATSPQTNVTQNFKYAVDALESYKAGRFDKIIVKFEEGLAMLKHDTWRNWYDAEKAAGRVVKPPAKPTPEAFMAHWIAMNDLKPKQSNGNLYGTHSTRVLQVFARVWLDKTKGPKTRNFVENLLGEGHEATIDLWADRTMRRMGYEGYQDRWRILPLNQAPVKDADFYFAQKAFRAAAERLGMQPDALQGALWFAEKKHWAKNGWGKLDLGDFQTEMKKLPKLREQFKKNVENSAERATVEQRKLQL